HVPPFRESCWHEGRITTDTWLPHFTCKAVGDVLGDIMRAHPQQHATVLCGHTHGRGEARIMDNLLVLTGGATYGKPEVQRILNGEYPFDPTQLAEHLKVASEAAQRGGAVLQEWQGRFSVREKGRLDLVTEADVASQETVRSFLQSRYP